MISHEGYCGLYIQVHVRYSSFPAARPQSNVHTLTHSAYTSQYSGAILRCFSILRESSFSMCSHTKYVALPHANNLVRLFRPALKENEFANMLIFDPRVLRDFIPFTVYVRLVLYISHLSVIKFESKMYYYERQNCCLFQ